MIMKTPRETIIDVLNIPTQEKIKESLSIPDYQDTIDNFFSPFPEDDNTDYMLDALGLDACASEIKSKYSDEFNEISLENIKQVFRDNLPVVSDIVTNFRNFLPSKQDIISLINVPTKEEIIDQYQYPMTLEQLSLVLVNATNRDDVITEYGSETKVDPGIRTKFGVLTKQKVICKLDELKQSTSDIDIKNIIDDLKTIVPEYITSDVVNMIIPDEALRNYLLQVLSTPILMPVKTIISRLEIPIKNDIIEELNKLSDYPTKEEVLNIIPDIECRRSVELLYKNVITPVQTLFDSFNIPNQETIYDKLDVNSIAKTFNIPKPDAIIATFNLPDYLQLVNSYIKSIPDGFDFIDSLQLPGPLDAAKIVFNHFSDIVTQKMKPFICSIVSQCMIQNWYILQYHLGIRSQTSLIEALQSVGFLPHENQVIESLDMPTYEEMANQLGISIDDKLVEGMKQLFNGTMNLNDLTAGDDAQFTRNATADLMASLNPKTIMDAIGEESYKDAAETINSLFSSSDQVCDFFKDGNL